MSDLTDTDFPPLDPQPFVTEEGREIERLRAELAALVAERNKLVEDNASQTYKGNSVCYWHDKANAYKATIGSLWEILKSAAVRPDGERTITAALTALVAERNALVKERNSLVWERSALRQLVAELEAQLPADRDLRERLLESALQGLGCRLFIMEESDAEQLGRQAAWIVNGALAEMRKEEADGK